jgi:glucokinase
VEARTIGVDVGGTKVAVATLDDASLDARPPVPTELAGPEELIAQLVALVRACGPADAVGLGVPSVVDFATGTVRSSVNIPLRGVPLRERLQDALGVPVFVENDASVAALAEAFDEAFAPVAQSLVMVTVGTGIGGGAIIGGRIFRGTTGAAPELGHILIGADLDGGAPSPAARPPHPGSFEVLAAGRALDRLGAERGIGDGPAVVAAAERGDAEAADAVRILGERLGIGIANVINLFDPELVVVGGGVSRAGELLLAPARETAWRFVIEGVGTRTRIVPARHGPQAGVRGAALLARQEMEGHG